MSTTDIDKLLKSNELMDNIKKITSDDDDDDVTSDDVTSYNSLYNTKPAEYTAEKTAYTEAKTAYNAAKTAYDNLKEAYAGLEKYKSHTSIKDTKKKFDENLKKTYIYNWRYAWFRTAAYKSKIKISTKISTKDPISIYKFLSELYNDLRSSVSKLKRDLSKARRLADDSSWYNAASRGLKVNSVKGDLEDAEDNYKRIKDQYERFDELVKFIISSYDTINDLFNIFDTNHTEYSDMIDTQLDNFNTKYSELNGKLTTYGNYMNDKVIIETNINDLSLSAKPNIYTSEYINKLNTNIVEINAIDASFNSYWLNNCDSDKSAIDASGWEKCVLNSQTASDQNKKISNDIIGTLTEEQKQSDRFKKAKEVDEAINTRYSYNYLSNTTDVSGGYTILSGNYGDNHGDIIQDISANTQFIENSYNNCDDPFNSLNSYNSDNKPFCLVNEYNDADATCKNAISKSEFYNYTAGTTKLNDFWSSVDNSIPGNYISTNANTLVGAKSTCNTWINMFNKWEAAEEEAIANPCSSERPIQSANDPVILKIIEEWSKSATSYIEKLMRRLEIIQIYIQKYPNILELEAKDVRFGPSSIGASMILRMDKNQTMGVAPVQYLEMLIPNGDKGETGVKGEKGIPGDPGLTGTRGKVGKTGDPTISSRLV